MTAQSTVTRRAGSGFFAAAFSAAAFFTAALIVACAGAKEGSPPPNVLLITLDTLRADHLGLYGHEPTTSPFLDRLAANSVVFDRAYAASNVTKPSHASILTGLYPKDHGLLANSASTLAPGVPTLAGQFRAAGYNTFAAVATPLLNARFSGLDQGFDVYLDTPGSLTAESAVRRALHYLDSESWEGPTFAWLHFYDPHIKYSAPEKYFNAFWPAGQAATPGPPIAPRGGVSTVKGAIPQQAALGEHTDPALYTAAYNAEILYLDSALETLFAALLERGFLDHAVVAITADHGEMLGEHGIFYNHASLYEPVLRVPLIVSAPTLEAGARRGEVVETVSLASTLLELAGVEWAEGGVAAPSLTPILTGATNEADPRIAFSQHSYGTAIRARSGNAVLTLPVPSDADSLDQLEARFDPEAFARYADYDAPRFFDLDLDPLEEHNLYARDDRAVAALERRLIEWYRARLDLPRPTPTPLPDELKRDLEALGYL